MMSDISNGEAMWGRMSVLRRGLNRPQSVCTKDQKVEIEKRGRMD